MREFDQGLLPRQETLAYQRALIDSVYLLTVRRQDLEFAKRELAALMNVPPGVEFQVAEANETALPASPREIAKLEDMALLQRPELREEDFRKRITADEARKQILGVLPGGGPLLAAFGSYSLEKKLSRTPERFGNGAIEGVAGPEAANNAAAGGAFIPLMTLGIPPNVVMALLLGAFVIHGLQPGPLMMSQNPQIFWGIVASMYVGNIMLLSNFISEYLIGAIQGTIIIIAMLVQRSLARKA